MIKEFVDIYMSNKHHLETKYREKQPDEYSDIVKDVVSLIHDNIDSNEHYHIPDPENIHVINDGDYQGTLVFIIPEEGYQPSNYWYVRISYGSCSGCDTFCSIKSDGEYDGPANESQLKDYMTLALHIIQGLKKMDDEEV